ncbi:MAG: HAMP domain-containing histidine kinase, partial [Pirellulales bacterium]|nr:HAMP domain-containing histidine kinase [Pirellulales bacterium]
PPAWPLATAGLLALLNGAYGRLGHRVPVRPALWTQILADLAILTAVIHFLGSTASYAPFMYLFHIILACIFFPRFESAVVTVAAVALYLGCLLAESWGLLSPATVFADPGAALLHPLRPATQFWHVGSALAIWAVIWYLASRLAGELRQRERELALANQRLKASSDERARHMLQTTHQLKAPFAAIHAHTQLLAGGYCGPLSEKAQGVVEKITARCSMLSRQIQAMLQLANLRSEAQSNPPLVEIALDDAIRTSVARIEPAAAQRDIRIETKLEPARITAAEDHVRMLLENLLTNAVNYSYDGGLVTVACRRASDETACLDVRDRGIGIPQDKLPRIFEDYFRTAEAALHNKASTGLGLAIVRQIARAAGITVRVESAPQRGTCFTLTIPIIASGPPARHGTKELHHGVSLDH